MYIYIYICVCVHLYCPISWSDSRWCFKANLLIRSPCLLALWFPKAVHYLFCDSLFCQIEMASTLKSSLVFFRIKMDWAFQFLVELHMSVDASSHPKEQCGLRRATLARRRRSSEGGAGNIASGRRTGADWGNLAGNLLVTFFKRGKSSIYKLEV